MDSDAVITELRFGEGAGFERVLRVLRARSFGLVDAPDRSCEGAPLDTETSDGADCLWFVLVKAPDQILTLTCRNVFSLPCATSCYADQLGRSHRSVLTAAVVRRRPTEL
ncbi:hypothetical protein NDU88_002230 [Pleurodeles waltl]|uniref:Uncharacterized protein n=1 Tax=Pleurodeles waltl TaxID=8319 RepID=A0AAV7TMH9_PLEWA|nr:hypothetical protein NDU88_002230 [Pleurodeles waltl]